MKSEEQTVQRRRGSSDSVYCRSQFLSHFAEDEISETCAAFNTSTRFHDPAFEFNEQNHPNLVRSCRFPPFNLTRVLAVSWLKEANYLLSYSLTSLKTTASNVKMLLMQPLNSFCVNILHFLISRTTRASSSSLLTNIIFIHQRQHDPYRRPPCCACSGDCGASSLLGSAGSGQTLLPDQLLAMWARSSRPPPRCSLNCHPEQKETKQEHFRRIFELISSFFSPFPCS